MFRAREPFESGEAGVTAKGKISKETQFQSVTSLTIRAGIQIMPFDSAHLAARLQPLKFALQFSFPKDPIFDHCLQVLDLKW